MARARFVPVQRDGHAVAEDRQGAAQIGIAIAHIVHTCTQIGTRKAAALAVATVPPKPGMMRTASRKAGEPTGNRFTHAGSRCRYSSRSPELRRVAIDPIPEQRRAHQSEDIDERAPDRTEDRAVHDRQCVGHRKRRRCDDDEDRDRERDKRKDRSCGSRARRAADGGSPRYASKKEATSSARAAPWRRRRFKRWLSRGSSRYSAVLGSMPRFSCCARAAGLRGAKSRARAS